MFDDLTLTIAIYAYFALCGVAFLSIAYLIRKWNREA